jgi:uncharacterized protein YyaL (SSP411 family)
MNRLSTESSLYLRQHADNPVDWHPWDESALQAARDLNRPILLSIGYSACHWCHVMAHESFEHEQSAQLMNELFLNIKVDREERPDLDRIYQLSHQLLTGRGGGWPLTLFLDPLEHTPFFAGTYFPPERRHGMPSFREVLMAVRKWFDENREEIDTQNHKLRDAIKGIQQSGDSSGIDEGSILAGATGKILSNYDPVNGGFGGAPKFPQAPLLTSIARMTDEKTGPKDELRRSLDTTLEKMALSGLRDHLDGGFFRYCVDATWTIPHFEKMLYDNAQLLPLYADAWRRNANPLMAQAAEGIAAWLISEMQHDNGGYSASIDADAAGEEGGFHVWTRDTLRQLLPDDLYTPFCGAFGVDGPPNFEGRAWHLVRTQSTADFAKLIDEPEAVLEKRLADASEILYKSRSERVHPTLDPKQLTSWNALLAEGFVRAGMAMDRSDWLDIADRIFTFLRREMWNGKQLRAVYNSGEAKFAAYLDDHAFLLSALIRYLQARWSEEHLQFAITIADALLGRFEDPENGGFYFSDASVDVPIARSLSFHDDATPAGNAVACSALWQLGHLTGELRFEKAAQKTLKRAVQDIARSPASSSGMLAALNESINAIPQVIIGGTDDAEQKELKRWVTGSYRVNCYQIGPTADSLPGILGEHKTEDPLTAWVCHGMKCLPPVTTREALKRQLDE